MVHILKNNCLKKKLSPQLFFKKMFSFSIVMVFAVFSVWTLKDTIIKGPKYLKNQKHNTKLQACFFTTL